MQKLLFIYMTHFPFSETKYLCISSGLIGISSVILYLLREYTMSFFSGILCLTSVNHWRDYIENGWRQRVDISWIVVMLLYLMLNIIYYGTEFQIYLFLAVISCMMIFFHISTRGKEYWIVSHSTLHLYFSFFVPMLYIL